MYFFFVITFKIHHPYKNNPDIPQTCDPLGEKEECKPYSGTGCWTIYWYWPAFIPVEPEESKMPS